MPHAKEKHLQDREAAAEAAKARAEQNDYKHLFNEEFSEN